MYFDERYVLEQMFLPQSLYGEGCQQTMLALLQGKGEFLVYMLNAIGQQTGSKCPYTADQFVFKPLIISDHGDIPEFAMLIIDMPEPEIMPLSSRLIICHDKELSKIKYFTVEKTLGGAYMLCGVSEDSVHVNYGDAPESEEDLFKRVYELYTDYLTESKV